MLKRIFPGFLPWIGLGLAFQWLPSQWVPPIWIALLIYLILFSRRFLAAGHSISWTNLVLFITLFLNGYLGLSPWLSRHGSLVCYATFGIVGAITILAGAPFSAVYARMQVPKEKWDHPVFKQINYAISAVWVFVFILNAAVCGLLVEPPYAARLVCLSFVISAIVFSDRYPTYVRKNARAGETSTLQ